MNFDWRREREDLSSKLLIGSVSGRQTTPKPTLLSVR